MKDGSICAAQYIRMSTERQEYSMENQSDVIKEYARKRGMEIVRVFSDAGKSGLRLEGRDGLKSLIECVQSGQTDFSVILVYDVSRWGRFQDADESAYYEYICKRAGISVLYCGEQFENDGSPISTIVKGVKRAMAGEYSRELSAKVFKGQCRLVELGYRQGGSAGYGLRRLLMGQDGTPKAELQRGEQKSIQTDRVILIPGPIKERTVVQRIYHLFVKEGWTEQEIADDLNRSGHPGEQGRPWTRSTVHQVLTNEKYVGHNVYNRISFKLKKKRVRNPPEMWVRHEGAFEPLVETEDFLSAQSILLERHRIISDEELLERLTALHARHGKLSGILIDEAEGMPSSAVYRHRFGSLIHAYQLIGYIPAYDYAFLEINRRLRRIHSSVVDSVILALKQRGASVSLEPDTELLSINKMIVVSMVIARCHRTEADALHWNIRLEESLTPDLTLVIRMDPPNQSPLDYYLLPSLDIRSATLRIKEDNGIYLDSYRFKTLDYFFGMAEQVCVEAAA